MLYRAKWFRWSNHFMGNVPSSWKWNSTYVGLSDGDSQWSGFSFLCISGKRLEWWFFSMEVTCCLRRWWFQRKWSKDFTMVNEWFDSRIKSRLRGRQRNLSDRIFPCRIVCFMDSIWNGYLLSNCKLLRFFMVRTMGWICVASSNKAWKQYLLKPWRKRRKNKESGHGKSWRSN